MEPKAPILLLLILFTGCSVMKPSEELCGQYQNGTFKQYVYNNSGLGHWKRMTYVTNRVDSFQTIITISNLLPPDTLYYSIKWLNPCSYEINYIKGADDWLDSLLKNKHIPPSKSYRISKATPMYYIQSYDRKQKDTLWIQRKLLPDVELPKIIYPRLFQI
jgi:hypothetical protein